MHYVGQYEEMVTSLIGSKPATYKTLLASRKWRLCTPDRDEMKWQVFLLCVVYWWSLSSGLILPLPSLFGKGISITISSGGGVAPKLFKPLVIGAGGGGGGYSKPGITISLAKPNLFALGDGSLLKKLLKWKLSTLLTALTKGKVSVTFPQPHQQQAVEHYAPKEDWRQDYQTLPSAPPAAHPHHPSHLPEQNHHHQQQHPQPVWNPHYHNQNNIHRSRTGDQ